MSQVSLGAYYKQTQDDLGHAKLQGMSECPKIF